MRSWYKNIKIGSVLLVVLGLFSMYTVAALVLDKPLPFARDRLSLGLDLQGGSSLLLGANFDLYFSELLDSTALDVSKTLKQALIAHGEVEVRENAVEITQLSTVPKQLDSLRDRFDIEKSGSGITMRLNGVFVTTLKKNLVADTINNVRRRIDSLGVKEVSIQPQGRESILIEVPGVNDPNEIRSIVGKTARMTFHIVVDGNDPLSRARAIKARDKDGKEYWLSKTTEVGGDMLQTAMATYSTQNHKPIVVFSFNYAGTQKFADLTQKSVGKPLAILIDGIVVAAPVIREPIMGGRGEISGNFTASEVNELAIMLRSGALPVQLITLEERVIGPTLGADSVRTGRKAIVYSFICVSLFMIAVYSYCGIIATIALLATVSTVILLLCKTGATLTLPGVAGIVLTIGMAVDANVLIFEKMREELLALKKGETKITMSKLNNIVNTGYHKASSAIIDSNITTIIAGITLFAVGDGPLRGFAITLCWGVTSSFIMSVLLSKVLMNGLLKIKADAIEKLC